jgi:hydroxymethylpyrimidine pyrophosphatase-like HAD family hydrolase
LKSKLVKQKYKIVLFDLDGTSVTDFVTAPLEEDGVTKAIDKFILGS